MPTSLTKHSRNPTRDAKIVAYYRSGLSLREIGRVFSISHERVRQIIASYEANSQLVRARARGDKLMLDEERRLLHTFDMIFTKEQHAKVQEQFGKLRAAYPNKSLTELWLIAIGDIRDGKSPWL